MDIGVPSGRVIGGRCFVLLMADVQRISCRCAPHDRCPKSSRSICILPTPYSSTHASLPYFLPPVIWEFGQLHCLLLQAIGIQHEIKDTHNQYAAVVIVRCRCIFGNNNLLESVTGHHQGTLFLFHFCLIRNSVG